LSHTVVTASAAGVVANVDSLQVGEYLEAGMPAFNLVATGDIWIEASPKETQLTYVAAGNPATVTIDAYPHRVWPATVASISPASGAEFSVLPAVNSSGNWVKVVQRVPLRLSLAMPQDAPPLRAGMSAVVEIDTGHRRTVGELFRTIGRWIGL
jgi:membrane fusion protein (multidrug efflux system)